MAVGQGGGKGRSGPTHPIESVDNVLRLLILVARQKRVRVSDASDQLGTAVSTAHRLLAMLAYHGFVVQDPDSKIYEQGPVLLEVGLSAVRNLDVRSSLRSVVKSLRDEVGETVHLAIVNGNKTLFVDCAESPVALRVASRVGTSMWAHCTSSGKVWLASCSDEAVVEIYPDEDLPALTANSLTTRTALLEQLSQVRSCGYAQSHAESELGVGSVSALVSRPDGRPAAALTVSAPLVRMPDDRRDVLVKAVVRASSLARGLLT